MANILIRNLSFQYLDPQRSVFDNLSLNLSTNWKTGVIGNSTAGKTTFLKLVSGTLKPLSGSISLYENSIYFPFKIAEEELPTFEIIKECIAPFDKWEAEMKLLLEKGDPVSLLKYEELLRSMEQNDFSGIEMLILQESSKLGLEASRLEKRFSELTSGEKIRALLAGIFLKKNSFPVIDDISESLSICERELVADYLSFTQKGFIFASADRFMLDNAVNQIIEIGRSNVRTNRGNYSVFKLQLALEEDFAKRREEESLTVSSERFCGEGALAERSNIIIKNNFRISSPYKKEESEGTNPNTPLFRIDFAVLEMPRKYDIGHLTFDICKGDRISLIDRKGVLGSSILNEIKNKIEKNETDSVKISLVNKLPIWESGYLKDRLAANNIDLEKFRNIANDFKMPGTIFERPLSAMRKSRLKMIDLCTAFCFQDNLQLWDHPLHLLDIPSRELLEELISAYDLTILFAENDRFFINNISSKIIDLPS